MQALFYVTFLAVATFLWGYLFYKKDYHPQPFSIIWKTFSVGLFAMVPLFGYKWLYQNYLPTLAEYKIFEIFTQSSLGFGVGAFLLNMIFLSVLLFTFSAIISLVLTLFEHPVLVNIKRAAKEEPLGFTLVSVLIGILVYIESVISRMTGISIVRTVLGTILFLTIIEEYIKHLVVRFIDDKKIRDIDDAITLSIMVGLAFAFVESLIYALAVQDPSLVVYRSFISIPIHLVSSGIFGYYYGLAHFAKPIVQNTGGDRGSRWLSKILTLKNSVCYSEEKIVEGILFATLFHAVNNVLLEINLAFLTIPVIVLGLMMIAYLYRLGFADLWMIKTKKAASRRLKKA